LERAALLLPTASGEIDLDPSALKAGIEGGASEFDLRLARHLMSSIDFAPDDQGPKRIIELALSSSIAVCRRHPDIHKDLTQTLLIEAAHDHGIQISILNRLDLRMAELLEKVDEIAKSKVISHDKKIFDNLLDLFHGGVDGDKLYIDVAVKESGQVVVFSNYSLNSNVIEMLYFPNNNRCVFVTDEWKLRDVGISMNPDMAKYIKESGKVLIVRLNRDSGKAEEGFYLPLRVLM
jgi:hypothetical protein